MSSTADLIAELQSAAPIVKERTRRVDARRRGEDNPSARLTELQVLEVLAMRKVKISIREMAQAFDVSMGCIREIIYGRTWKHLPR